jgi:hypothetical protein
LVILKLKVGDCRQRVEIFAMRHRCRAVVVQDMARVVSVNMVAYERETPIKGPHKAVVIPLVMRALAPVHECFPQNSITSQSQFSWELRGQAHFPTSRCSNLSSWFLIEWSSRIVMGEP